MSKVGKQPIVLPEGVKVSVSGQTVSVKGPKGELSWKLPDGFGILEEGNIIRVIPPEKQTKKTSALWGTNQRILANMVQGVWQGFEKILEFEGIGYKAEVSGNELVLYVGFTHPVRLRIPSGIEVTVDKNLIKVSGYNKELVGEFAARIRRLRIAEPYKGTGIRYKGEVIRRKAGKKLAGAAG